MSAPRSYSLPYPLCRFATSPPDRGSRPRSPFYGSRQLGSLNRSRKGAGGSADCFSLVFRCRWLGANRVSGTPLVGSAFVAAGLKLCGRKRRAARCAAPTAYSEVIFSFRRGRTLAGPPIIDQLSPARQSQARKWNRTSGNFCKPRAQWPGRNLECHSDFARRKFCKIQQVRVPRKGGPGVRRIWARQCPSGAVPRRSFGFFPIAGKETRRPGPGA